MTKLNNQLRDTYTQVIMDALAAQGEEALRVASNQVAIPVVDAENNEKYVVFTIKVPTGTRDGDEYNGYNEAEAYEAHCRLQAEKKAEAARKKAEKVAKDAARRAAKQKAEQ